MNKDIKTPNELLLVGGVGKSYYSASGREMWSMGYRVYDTNGISTTLSAVGA